MLKSKTLAAQGLCTSTKIALVFHASFVAEALFRSKKN